MPITPVSPSQTAQQTSSPTHEGPPPTPNDPFKGGSPVEAMIPSTATEGPTV